VSCVIDQFGPSELLTMGGWHDQPKSPEAKLIGGPVQENQERARNASPVSYVSPDDPPFMLLHGTEDPIVPFSQSERLSNALKQAGVESLLVPVAGGGHGGFRSGQVPLRVKQFFDKHLLGKPTAVSTDPIVAAQPRR
jgi:dipeptidyl aminopeptidase/acylaminoacyl peptidase